MSRDPVAVRGDKANWVGLGLGHLASVRRRRRRTMAASTYPDNGAPLHGQSAASQL
ncbi:hypothetical protein [Ruicaihuangia caeni]|uniref:hypothetical protein n=1 Tax=Ruicaihuangia caeni TaxID=3042517 RepID=UPI00248BFE38|nr:hypothetical protein [Klugiella sp. YN-L-19]